MASETWTQERVERLTELWRVGLSCSQIAADIGGATRNAVIGKIHRLKLDEPTHKKKSKPEKPKKPAQPKRPRERARQGDHHVVFKISAGGNGSTRITQSNKAPVVPKLRCVEAAPRLLTFAELQENDCRYPYGDGELSTFRFCGHPKLAYMRRGLDARSSYCGPHHDLTVGAGTISERSATRGIAA